MGFAKGGDATFENGRREPWRVLENSQTQPFRQASEGNKTESGSLFSRVRLEAAIKVSATLHQYI